MSEGGDKRVEDVAMFKAAVISEVENATHFRRVRAERYPDDDRNERSADALAALGQNLAGLPGDDANLGRCFDAYRARHREAGNIEAGTAWLGSHDLWFPAEFGEFPQKRIFSQYGFHDRARGNVEYFLLELAEEIEDWSADELKYDEIFADIVGDVD